MQTEDGMWSMMFDGLNMKFILIIRGETVSSEALDSLYKSHVLQSTSKALEVQMHLPLRDLFSEKHYFPQGKTLEWILHNAVSNSNDSIALFKHTVSKKWNQTQ